MPHNHEWQTRIKAVAREYVAMRQAADHFMQTALSDATVLRENLHYGEIVKAGQSLEATYLIRLFAEFETGARQYWKTKWDTVPRASDLVDGLAARCLIPLTLRDDVHSVREYRNTLIHEREEQLPSVPIDRARSYLCRFFSRLPREW